jgi:hypothetical protein
MGRDCDTVQRLHAFANPTSDAILELASGAMRALGVGGTLGGFLVSTITALTGA